MGDWAGESGMPDVIMRVLTRKGGDVKTEGEMEWCAQKIEEDGQGKESRQPLEAEKGQEMDCPFTASKRAAQTTP